MESPEEQFYTDTAAQEPLRFFTTVIMLKVLRETGAISDTAMPTKEDMAFVSRIVSRTIERTLDRLYSPWEKQLNLQEWEKVVEKALQELRRVCFFKELREVVRNQDKAVAVKICIVLSTIIAKRLKKKKTWRARLRDHPIIFGFLIPALFFIAGLVFSIL